MTVIWWYGPAANLWHTVRGLDADPRIVLTVCRRRCVVAGVAPRSANGHPACPTCAFG